MTYKVLKAFSDLNDGKHNYMVGDTFPRHGFSVSDERLKELSGSKNAFGCPLIEAVKEPAKTVATPVKEEPKPVEEKVEQAEPKAKEKAPKRAKKAE